MFIWSMKMKKGRMLFAGIILLVAIALLIYFIMGSTEKSTKNALKFSDTADLVEYIESYGWEVEPLPCEEVEVVVPEEFDDVYTNYNAIQMRQGFDLAEYQGERVKRTTFVLLNYPEYPENMRVDILTYKNEIVGADVCSLEIRGFMHGIGELWDQLDGATTEATESTEETVAETDVDVEAEETDTAEEAVEETDASVDTEETVDENTDEATDTATDEATE